MTPLYPTFEKRIDDATAGILNRQVEPWLFLSQGLTIHRFDGRPIAISGVEFEGSPRHVFWTGYIEPFLQELVVKELAEARSLAKEREVDGKLVLCEVRGLLTSSINRVYARMAEVDQRLLGKGFPRATPVRTVSKETSDMTAFLAHHFQAELQMWRPRSTYEVWYERNKFLVWVLGTAAAVGIALLRFL